MTSLMVLAVLHAAAPTKPEDVALGIIADLKAGNADAAHSKLGPTAGAVPPQTLLAAWKQQADALGALQKIELATTTEQQGYTVFVHTARFEKGALTITTAVDPKLMKAEGFFIKPAMPELPPAAYVNKDAFTTTDVTFGAPTWELGGTLTLPKGKGPFPAVVLVHGSGPHDRDETIGASKPFKDLAEGLSSKGIVVLRYDKRTLVHGKRMTGVVKLDDEVVNDALAALELVAARPEVDPKKVFVLGHSLGAQLGPEIATRCKACAGAILLAPPARKPCELIIDQLEHTQQTAVLEEVKAQCAKMKTGKATGTLLGAPVEYWQELASKDGIAVAKKLSKPLLVMHGARDYQVTNDDFAAWKKALEKVKGVELVEVPKGNHLFIEGEGVSMPAEYGKPGHVALQVIERVAGFTNR